jgi:hypothetical protein
MNCVTFEVWEVFIPQKAAFVGPVGNLGSDASSPRLVCRLASFALNRRVAAAQNSCDWADLEIFACRLTGR